MLIFIALDSNWTFRPVSNVVSSGEPDFKPLFHKGFFVDPEWD